MHCPRNTCVTPCVTPFARCKLVTPVFGGVREGVTRRCNTLPIKWLLLDVEVFIGFLFLFF